MSSNESIMNNFRTKILKEELIPCMKNDINDIIFHLDDLNTFDTFHHLCKADILCMGTSSFSILAAFYNKNTVIYLPYCHPPSSNKWIKYEE